MMQALSNRTLLRPLLQDQCRDRLPVALSCPIWTCLGHRRRPRRPRRTASRPCVPVFHLSSNKSASSGEYHGPSGGKKILFASLKKLPLRAFFFCFPTVDGLGFGFGGTIGIGWRGEQQIDRWLQGHNAGLWGALGAEGGRLTR